MSRTPSRNRVTSLDALACYDFVPGKFKVTRLVAVAFSHRKTISALLLVLVVVTSVFVAALRQTRATKKVRVRLRGMLMSWIERLVRGIEAEVGRQGLMASGIRIPATHLHTGTLVSCEGYFELNSTIRTGMHTSGAAVTGLDGSARPDHLQHLHEFKSSRRIAPVLGPQSMIWKQISGTATTTTKRGGGAGTILN